MSAAAIQSNAERPAITGAQTPGGAGPGGGTPKADTLKREHPPEEEAEAGGETEPSTTPGEAEGETESPEITEGPKGLIDAVTALRAERRELKAELEAVKQTLEAVVAKREQTADEAHAEGNGESGTRGSSSLQPQGDSRSSSLQETDAAMFDAEVQQVLRDEQGQRGLVSWSKQQLRLLEKNPEAVLAELKRRQIQLADESPEVIRDWLESVHEAGRDKLDDLIVERRAVVNVARQRNAQIQQETGKTAETILPEKKDAGSDRAKLFEHVMKNNPGLKQVPDGELRAAVQVLGIERAMQAIAAGGGDPVAALKLGKLGLKGPAKAGAAAAAPYPARATNGKVVHAKPTTRLPGAPVNAPGGTGTAGEPDARELYRRYAANPTEESRRAWMRATLGAGTR